MAVKIKTNQLAGYENTAFNYRYLNTTLTPLDILEQAMASTQMHLNLGANVVRLFSEAWTDEEMEKFLWLRELSTFGRTYDRTYRLLADEYYRQVDISNVVRTEEL